MSDYRGIQWQSVTVPLILCYVQYVSICISILSLLIFGLGARLSPKRNSLPTSRRHAVSMSTASPDSSPQAPHLGDLLDSLESNERAIDVEFPPTPPSTSLSERDSSLLQPPSDNSLQSIPDGSGADSNSEHYKKLSAIQASLQGPSLRSSGRRRFRSHLLQYDSNQDLSEQPHHSYVLSVGSPNGPTG